MFAWQFTETITQYRRFCSVKQLAFGLFIVMLVLLPNRSDANVRLCGAKLTATLKVVCKNQVCGGHVFAKQKRAYINNEGAISYLRHLPSGSNSEALQRFTRSSYQRGIVSECCSKKCTLKHLTTYCCLNRQMEQMPVTTTTESSVMQTEDYNLQELEE